MDCLGGHLDAFTSKEYAGYYIKVLDEHLPKAIDVLSDLVLNPAFAPADIEREKKVILEEIKMVEDTPDDLVHETVHAELLGRASAGPPDSGHARERRSADAPMCCEHISPARTPRRNLVIAPSATSTHERMRELVEPAFGAFARSGRRVARAAAGRVAASAGPQQGARTEPRVPRHRAATRRTTTIGTRRTC